MNMHYDKIWKACPMCKTFWFIVLYIPSCKLRWTVDLYWLCWHKSLKCSASSSDKDRHPGDLHCYSGFAFGQPNDALCFSCILTIIQWQCLLQLEAYCACVWSMWKKMYMCLFKKTLSWWHVTANAISLFLFSKLILVKLDPSFFMTLHICNRRKLEQKMEVLHTIAIINKRLLSPVVHFIF